ncbi:MAG: ketoacyl-ACP synthase III [Roseburia sp.]|nr:ketoacyl-ACP synthase III [Roseburia sp.]
MKGIHIVATGRAIPKKILTNDDMSKIVETSDEWITERTGIKQRHICEEETCKSLAVDAAKKAIEEAIEREGLELKDIGVVVVATATSTYAFPSTACLVQKELGLEKDTMSFDISAACSGFIYGIEVCRGLLCGSQKKYALLIGSEQLSRIVDFTDRSSCILFGDGAGAAVLRLDDSLYAHKAWSNGNDEVLYCPGVGIDGAKLKMDGQEVFKFAVRALRQGMEEVMAEAGVGIEDVDYVVCHQANRRIIEHVMKKYPGQEEKFYINIDEYANTSAASIPIALDEMREKSLLKEGMKIVTVGFGAGLTWSGAFLTI